MALTSGQKIEKNNPNGFQSLSVFDDYWQSGNSKEAIRVYEKSGRPFWQTEQVGKYYEKQGLIKKAMQQYELLIKEYIKMKILPLPSGPIELYKLGKWYQKSNPAKAKKYLGLYLRTEECKNDPAFRMPYKDQARRLLLTIDSRKAN